MALNIARSFPEPSIGRQVVLTSEQVREICQKVLETMKNGLPDEAHSIEVLEYILEESRDMLRSIPIKL